jgi:hypothetical protein
VLIARWWVPWIEGELAVVHESRRIRADDRGQWKVTEDSAIGFIFVMSLRTLMVEINLGLAMVDTCLFSIRSRLKSPFQ